MAFEDKDRVDNGVGSQWEKVGKFGTGNGEVSEIGDVCQIRFGETGLLRKNSDDIGFGFERQGLRRRSELEREGEAKAFDGATTGELNYGVGMSRSSGDELALGRAGLGRKANLEDVGSSLVSRQIFATGSLKETTI